MRSDYSKLLLQKLCDIGIKESAHKIIESYLSNRHQVDKISATQSTPELITYGIPQGSILGPLLFLIYINNMKYLKSDADITLYSTILVYFMEMKFYLLQIKHKRTLTFWTLGINITCSPSMYQKINI